MSTRTDSYRILLEKLTNLSQFQCILLPPADDTIINSAIKLRDKSTLLLELSNKQLIVPLPVDLQLDKCTIQSINKSTVDRYDIIRGKYVIDRTISDDHEFPTPTELSYTRIRELYCRGCGNAILNSNSINSCTPLPSEYWNELVDMWYCHTAGPTAQQIGIHGNQIDYDNVGLQATDEHPHSQQAAIGARHIHATTNKILISQTQLLIHYSNMLKGNVTYNSHDAVNNESIDDQSHTTDTTSQYWCWLHCNQCESLLGEIELYTTTLQPLSQPTGQTRLYKYSLWSPAHISIDANTMLTRKLNVTQHALTHTINIFQYYNVIRCITEQLLAAAAAHITYRFNITSSNNNSKVLYLTIISWDTTFKLIDCATTSTISPVMLPVIKCMYTYTDNVADVSRDDCEDVVLHHNELNLLLQSLNRSHEILPSSMSNMKGMKLAYLNRLTRKDFD